MTRVLVVVERLLIAFLAATVVLAMAVPFQTIEKGHYSGIEDALTEVYRTNKDFSNFWARHVVIKEPRPDVPTVDFKSQMIAVVFNGTKNSGGYDVEITSVEEDKNSNVLVINFMTSEPSPGSNNTMALTQPYHIISLDISDKKVVFMGSEPNKVEQLPTYIVILKKGIDRVAIRSKIEALPSVQHVTGMKGTSVGTIVFDSNSISKTEARLLLDEMEEITAVEEEY